MRLNRAIVRNPDTGYLEPRLFCRHDVIKRVIGKTWTGTLANSADPDQTPQNAASDQGLLCLLTLQELRAKRNGIKYL